MNQEDDEAFRPASYFGPMSLRQHKIGMIKNAVIRGGLEQLQQEGRFEELDTLLADDAFSPRVIKALEAHHPSFLGGNYLPDLETGEVEIARIELDSVTADVTALYAKEEAGKIFLRLVDEYDGETLSGPTTLETTVPLTLGEMTDFFLNALSLNEILAMNEFEDPGSALAFFQAKSNFYPGFQEACVRRVKNFPAFSEK